MAPRCPYCNEVSIYERTSTRIYGRDYGAVYVCRNYPECDAYVGCHRGTKRPLGRLADRELRAAKKKAHAVFDPLWRAKMKVAGWTQHKARNAAYQWLSNALGIEPDKCHIGMFDVDMCNRVVEVCSTPSRRVHDRYGALS